MKSLAIDPTYRLRDNQFWYGDCVFAGQIENRHEITLFIEGLGERKLLHAQRGKDGRLTKSFKLPSREDRRWWKANRGRRVEVSLFGVTDAKDAGDAFPVKIKMLELNSERPKRIVTAKGCTPKSALYSDEVLCIGLDIAWFGGSAGKPESQYDCLASAIRKRNGSFSDFRLERVRLVHHDLKAAVLLGAIIRLLNSYDNLSAIVFSIDAPLMAAPRDNLPERASKSLRGAIERRACENYLSEHRRHIDRMAGGAAGWQPNIQPGAPVAPRVKRLIDGVQEVGFKLWSESCRPVGRVILECFPAEAIWAIKRMGHFRSELTARQVKAYKKQQGNQLDSFAVDELVRCVLEPLAPECGAQEWMSIVDQTVDWLIDDPTWRDGDAYRGGKLLDDVIDTLLCLATSVAFAAANAHVWLDPENTDDGHIIGPGIHRGYRWKPAKNVS